MACMRIRGAAALAGLLVAASNAGTASGLTLEQAERRALSQENVMQLLDARRAQARGAITSATTWPNPELSVSRESLDLADTTSRERFYWVYQELDLSGERGLRGDAARRDLDAVEHSLDARRRAIALRVREDFFTTLYQQTRLERIRHWRERLAVLVEQVRKQRRAGQAAAYEVVRLERAASAIETQAASARAARQRARAELAALIGERQETPPARLVGELGPEAPPSLQHCLSRLPKLPELQRLRARAEAKQLTAVAERRAAIPDITVGVGYKELRENGRRFDGNLISLGVRIPLFDRNQGERASARAAAQAHEAEYRLRLAELRGEVRGRWQELHELRQSAARFERDNERSASALVQAAEAGYRGAEVGVLELVDAYQNALDADLRLLELHKQARDAAIQLKRLTPGGFDVQ